MYFPDRGCLRTLLTLHVYTPLSGGSIVATLNWCLFCLLKRLFPIIVIVNFSYTYISQDSVVTRLRCAGWDIQ